MKNIEKDRIYALLVSVLLASCLVFFWVDSKPGSAEFPPIYVFALIILLILFSLFMAFHKINRKTHNPYLSED